MLQDVSLFRDPGVLVAVMAIGAAATCAIWLLSLRQEAADIDLPAARRGIETLNTRWFDPRWNRTLTGTLFYPDQGRGPFPIILVSHGLGGTQEDFAVLGRFWAAQGYACLHVQHAGSDWAAWQTLGARLSLHRAYSGPQMLNERTGDFQSALGQLERLNRRHYSLAGRLDLTRVGVMGQDLGGLAALAASGQVVVAEQRNPASAAAPAPEPASEPDPRIKGVLVLGDSFLPPGVSIAADSAGSELATLLVAATQRSVWRAPSMPRLSMHNWTEPAPYRVTLSVPHGPGIDGQTGPSGGLHAAALCLVLQQVALIFWDACLKHEARAVRHFVGGKAPARQGPLSLGQLPAPAGPLGRSVRAAPPQAPEMWCC